jgi:hypothetical protein
MPAGQFPFELSSWSNTVQTGLSAAILAAVSVALTGCSRHQTPNTPEPPAVLVTSVVQRDVPIYREWVAQLNGSVNAQISPKVSGYVTKRGISRRVRMNASAKGAPCRKDF